MTEPADRILWGYPYAMSTDAGGKAVEAIITDALERIKPEWQSRFKPQRLTRELTEDLCRQISRLSEEHPDVYSPVARSEIACAIYSRTASRIELRYKRLGDLPEDEEEVLM